MEGPCRSAANRGIPDFRFSLNRALRDLKKDPSPDLLPLPVRPSKIVEHFENRDFRGLISLSRFGKKRNVGAFFLLTLIVVYDSRTFKDFRTGSVTGSEFAGIGKKLFSSEKNILK